MNTKLKTKLDELVVKTLHEAIRFAVGERFAESIVFEDHVGNLLSGKDATEAVEYINTKLMEIIKNYERNQMNQNETYELDDEPLTPEQIQKIREVSTATNIPSENFTESLFKIGQVV